MANRDHPSSTPAASPDATRKHVYNKNITPRGTTRARGAKPGKTRKKAYQISGRAIGISSVCITAALLITLLLVTLLPGPFGDAAEVGSATSMSTIGTAQQSYSTGATSVDPVKYVGTVLPETEDAGIDYARDTLFVGDSNTLRMTFYHDITGVTLENCIAEAGMGIGSFCSRGLARFEGIQKTLTIPEAIEVLQPRRVVLTFGTNNVGMEMDTFLGHYKTALDAVKEAYPHADIIIGSIFPVDQYRQNTAITMPLIGKMNAALAEFAKREEVKFLNWSEAMLDKETDHSYFEHTLQDGVHLTRAGMDAIFTYFRTHSYITEDTRPTPLKAIPKRIGIQAGLITQDPAKVPGPIDWSRITSSSSSSSEEAPQPVNVVFSAVDESTGGAGGGTVNGGDSLTLTAMPGESTAGVQATPHEGYEFAYWSCSGGSLGDGGSAFTSFTVPSDAGPGSTYYVTAVFRKLADSSPPPSSQPPDSSVPQSLPPSSVPPDEGTSTPTGEGEGQGGEAEPPPAGDGAAGDEAPA